MGFFKDAILGVSLVGALRLSTRLITFAKIAILARLLTPEQFGLFGIATIVLAFLEIITESGINVFLIQEKAELKKFINTAWVISIVRGLTISLIILLTTPFIASFFRSPDSRTILYLISLVPFLRGFINPAVVRFQKELKFSKEFIFRLFTFSFDAIFAVAFALRIHSALSLVFGMIAGALAEIFLSHFLIKPRPKLNFEKQKMAVVINRGKWITLAGFFNYLFENVDNAVVGRLLDMTSLGFYQNTYKISSLPLSEVADVVKKVAFPIYVKFSDDLVRLKKAFLKSVLAISLIVIPIGLILLCFPQVVVRIILGEKWLAVVPVLRVMSFFGVIRAIIASSYPVFLSLKKQEYITYSMLAGILGLALTIVPFVQRFGITGAGLSALTGTLFEIPVVSYYLFKVFSQKKCLKKDLIF